MSNLPSPEMVRRLLRYDPQTGELIWLKRTSDLFSSGVKSADHNCAIWNARYAGKNAFTALDRHGYFHGAIFDRKYRAHRVAWVLATGSWPDGVIDHVNRDPSDNRIDNLRVATKRQNQTNSRSRRGSTSRYLGVSWSSARKKWRAQITFQGRNRYLGSFQSEADAARAYNVAAKRHHGEFANLNELKNGLTSSPDLTGIITLEKSQ